MLITLVRESKKPTVNNRLDCSTISRNLIYRISDYIWEVNCNLKKKIYIYILKHTKRLFCFVYFVLFLRTQLHLKFLAFFELAITSFHIVLGCFLFILSCKNNDSPRWVCRWIKLMILIYSEPFVSDTNEKQAVSEGWTWQEAKWFKICGCS